jgi:CrcB protein
MTPSPTSIAAVLLGGAAGCLVRYFVTLTFASQQGLTFPWATLLVNLVGSLFMGIAAKLLLGPHGPIEPWRILILVGFLGGLTTFSSFAFEIFTLIQAGRPLIAAVYWMLTNLLGITLLWLGWTATTYAQGKMPLN